MISRWLQLGLAGLFAVMGASAHADFFSEAVKKHDEIMGYLTNPHIKDRSQQNPMFGCYHIGRLQGVSDRLGKTISMMDQRAAKLTDKQFERLNLARNFYQGLEQTVAGAIDGKGCDAQSKKRLLELNAGKNSFEHINLAISATQTLSAQDVVIRCLYIGRLAVLLEYFRADITKMNRAGRQTNAENNSYRSGYNKVMAANQACGL